MNNELQKECRKYIKNIKKSLTCNYSLKKVFISDFKNQIQDFIELNPNATINDIESHFGNVTSITNNFGSLITDSLKKDAKRSKLVFLSIIIILIILFSILIFLIITRYGDFGVISDPYAYNKYIERELL